MKTRGKPEETLRKTRSKPEENLMKTRGKPGENQKKNPGNLSTKTRHSVTHYCAGHNYMTDFFLGGMFRVFARDQNNCNFHSSVKNTNVPQFYFRAVV